METTPAPQSQQRTDALASPLNANRIWQNFHGIVLALAFLISVYAITQAFTGNIDVAPLLLVGVILAASTGGRSQGLLVACLASGAAAVYQFAQNDWDFSSWDDISSIFTLTGAAVAAAMLVGALRARLQAEIERAQQGGARLAEREVLLATLTASAHDAIIVTSADGRIEIFNDAAHKLFGVPCMQALGANVQSLFKDVLDVVTHDAEAGTLLARAIECEARGADGKVLPVELRVTSFAAGGLTRKSWIARDISERRRITEQLQKEAIHDPLTGLANRRLLFDRMENALLLAKRHQHRLGVLFLDLDGFKKINDRLGHAAGDWLLRAASERIQRCVRGSDTAARIGGDEFVVLLPYANTVADVEVMAKRLIDKFALTHGLTGSNANVGMSIGVAVYPEHGSEAEDLLDVADRAMYAAKQSGGNRYRIAESPGARVAAIAPVDLHAA
jgi:diguanylate cyclase (GGDEF)-like protein/PAS domain S-box-containing protein